MQKILMGWSENEDLENKDWNSVDKVEEGPQRKRKRTSLWNQDAIACHQPCFLPSRMVYLQLFQRKKWRMSWKYPGDGQAWNWLSHYYKLEVMFIIILSLLAEKSLALSKHFVFSWLLKWIKEYIWNLEKRNRNSKFESQLTVNDDNLTLGF